MRRRAISNFLESSVVLAVQAGFTILAYDVLNDATKDWDSALLRGVAGDLLVLFVAAMAVRLVALLIFARPEFTILWYQVDAEGGPAGLLDGPKERVTSSAGSWQSIVKIGYAERSILARILGKRLQSDRWGLEIAYKPPAGYELHHEQVRNLEKEAIANGDPGVRLKLHRLRQARELCKMRVSIGPEELDLGELLLDLDYRVRTRGAIRSWLMGLAVSIDAPLRGLEIQ